MAKSAEISDNEEPKSASKSDKHIANEAGVAVAADQGDTADAHSGKADNGPAIPDGGSKPASKKRSATEAASGGKADAGGSAAAAAKPKKAKPAAGTPSLTGVRAYLETTVVPLLMTALQDLATQRPEDPLAWLGDFLKENAAKGNQDAAEATKKREAAAAAKASSKAAPKPSSAAGKASEEAAKSLPAANDAQAAKGNKKVSSPSSSTAKPAKPPTPATKQPAVTSLAAAGTGLQPHPGASPTATAVAAGE